MVNVIKLAKFQIITMRAALWDHSYCYHLVNVITLGGVHCVIKVYGLNICLLLSLVCLDFDVDCG
jgi:hypothetical protein